MVRGDISPSRLFHGALPRVPGDSRASGWDLPSQSPLCCLRTGALSGFHSQILAEQSAIKPGHQPEGLWGGLGCAAASVLRWSSGMLLVRCRTGLQQRAPWLQMSIVPMLRKLAPGSSSLTFFPWLPLSPLWVTLLSMWLATQAEKARAPHSSPLAWEIPWTEEPARLQSMGSLRVGHDWETSLSLFTFMPWRRKWQPTPVFLPGESQGRGSLVGCRLWGHTESDTTEVT